MRIIQYVSTLNYGDAVGNDVLAFRKAIRDMGYETYICAEVIGQGIIKDDGIITIRDMSEIPKDSIVLYHYASGTDMDVMYAEYPGKKAIVYHNVTPPFFFRDYNMDIFRFCEKGLKNIRFLSDKVDMCFADSEFNKKDLIKYGFNCPISVVPILIPFSDYGRDPDTGVIESYINDGYTNIVFVGRIAPNKKQEDIISAFYEYQVHYNRKSRLFIVGNWIGMETYYDRLRRYVERLRVENVVFTGHISFKEILSYYKLADVFLCMSEHEGFCVPLVEAMIFHVPIIAYDCCAIGETLGDSGIKLNSKNPIEAAAIINKVVTDEKLKETVICGQNERLNYFSPDNVGDILKRSLQDLINLPTSVKKKAEVVESKPKVCFVIQRYGLEVNGGAELQCRQFAEHILPYCKEVHVATTKAIDHMTWANEFKADEESINGIIIHRFSTFKERKLEDFTRINLKFGEGMLTEEGELKWLEEQGPLTPDLISYIKTHYNDFDVFIFSTYLYYHTVVGIREVAEKSILIPEAHDEPYINMRMFKDVFLKPRALFYNTEEERDFIQKKFNNDHICCDVGGIGIHVPEKTYPCDFKKKYGLSRYVLYIGRIDEGKNCAELFDYFSRYYRKKDGELNLVLMGKKAMSVPSDMRIIELGFVTDEDKFNGMAGAKAIIVPSKYESLSMVLLEAMAMGIPAIVNGECEVLKGHCIKSKGAYCYKNYSEFEKALESVLENGEKVNLMCRNAQKYVDDNYKWSVVTNRLNSLIRYVVQSQKT